MWRRANAVQAALRDAAMSHALQAGYGPAQVGEVLRALTAAACTASTELLPHVRAAAHACVEADKRAVPPWLKPYGKFEEYHELLWGRMSSGQETP